ncbi:MAG: hypothetical protein JRM98_03805 [Nitrososphaerota archaeon]|jgi:tetratricopeptide (TPR) repeat protein|nr:hypothetical protein [Nitrososphaerota archaeon]
MEKTPAPTPAALDQEYQKEFTRLCEASTPEGLLNAASRLRSDADGLFMKDDLVSRYHTAFKYRLAAELTERAAGLLKDENLDLLNSAGDLYHFAGHAFRRIEEFRWAGDAYAKSGECFMREMLKLNGRKMFIDSYEKSIRAYRRAKVVYTEVGDYSQAGRMFFLEQGLIQKKLSRTNPIEAALFMAWGIMSGYGESIRRWFVGYILGVALFGMIYLHGGTGVLQAFYVSFGRSLLMNTTSLGGPIMLLQFAYSYFNLGLGLTIIVRRMIGR